MKFGICVSQADGFDIQNIELFAYREVIFYKTKIIISMRRLNGEINLNGFNSNEILNQNIYLQHKYSLVFEKQMGESIPRLIPNIRYVCSENESNDGF